MTIGNGLSSVHISTERLHDIEQNIHLPEMSVWEKIKEFFCSTHQTEALQCIYNLFHHQELNLTSEKINKAFITLHELASPGYKDLFSIVNEGSQSEFILKGVKGEVLFSLNMKQKVKNMTLEEKIGQKIMLDFRYWDQNGSRNQDMTAPDEVIGKLITDNHVGGVILFANNLKDKQQIKTLTDWYAAMKTHAGIRLFIGTDNEGGSADGETHSAGKTAGQYLA